MADLRQWLMRLVAGRKYVWWVHPKVKAALADLSRNTALGHGAALALVESAKRSDLTAASWELTDASGTWSVVVSRQEPER